MARAMIPAPVQKVLSEHQARLFEARAILQLVSDALTQGDVEAHAQGNLMSAVDGALRILGAIDNLSDEAALARAAEVANA